MVNTTTAGRLRGLAGRARRAAARFTGGSRPGPPPVPTGPRCKVCGGPRIRRRQVTFHRDPSLTCRTRRCLDCGFIAIVRPEQSIWTDKAPMGSADPVDPSGDATDPDHPVAAPVARRIGTRARPGREFHMAKMAADMLGRDRLSVLVFGAGTNLDNHHIADLDTVGRVAIGDIMRIRDDADFVDLSKPARERFDVVIASEVVEHFRDPRRDFAHLFGFVADDGLVVAGTNIHAGNDLARDRYIFYPDHTAYYSPQALRMIANDLGFHLDFRAPMNASGMRKRYVYFSRSRSVLDDVATYFGTEVYPPSEVPQALRPPPQRSHAPWRQPVAEDT